MRHTSSAGLATTALLFLLAAGCGDGDGPTPPDPPDPLPNQAPVAVGSIAAVEVVAGEEVVTNVAANFNDPDGGALTYAATSSSTGVATAAASASQVTVTGVAPGQATITVTATDPGGLSATQSYTATVTAANQAPVAVGTAEEHVQTVGDTVAEIVVSEFFTDPDGDTLAYAASSADTIVATAVVDGNEMTVIARAAGKTTVTVTATDPGGLSAALDIPLTVVAANRAPEVMGSVDRQEIPPGAMATVELAGVIVDPDGDSLTFTAASIDTTVATVSVAGSVVTVTGVAPGDTEVDVAGTDPSGLEAATQFQVRVTAPAPVVADTIPTHDMMVDSAVALEMSPYFEGGNLTYMAATSDEMVAVAEVQGGVVVTKGVAAPMDSVATVLLSVTATNDAGSATQDSILVRIHQEAYDTLAGITANPDGTVSAVVLGSNFNLTTCVKAAVTSLAGLPVIVWSEWQRAVGSGWISVQDNNKVSTATGEGGSLCPLPLTEDAFPPGHYRLVGLVGVGDDPPRHYRTNTVEKESGEG